MINTDYQPYGIFFSAEPLFNDLKQAHDVYGVKYVLSLDRDVAARVAQRIRQARLPMQQTVYHINPGTPAGEAATFFNNALSYFSRLPVLVHCKAGKDRTGFAIASWLIKSGRQNACGAVADVTNKVGYGTGGISQIAKNSMDRVLGCMKADDTNEAEDIANEMRDEFAHQQGAQSAGTVDGGYWADHIGFGNNWSDPDTAYPGGTVGNTIRENPEQSYPEGAPRVARMRLLRRIIRMAKDKKDLIPGGLADEKIPEFEDEQLQKGIKVEMEHTDDKDIAREIALDHLVENPKYYDALEKMEKETEDKNDSFLGGGPQGSPTDELPSGQGAPAIPGVGVHDNYTGISSHMNAPSGAPGAPNAAGPVMPAQPNLTS